jgi:hypothetical protein
MTHAKNHAGKLFLRLIIQFIPTQGMRSGKNFISKSPVSNKTAKSKIINKQVI